MLQDYSHGYFGRCAVEGLLKTTLGYFGSTVVDEGWKGHSGACGVGELVWATPDPLWWMCCGRAVCYSGPPFGCGRVVGVTLGPIRDHFGRCALEEVLWAIQGSLASVLGYSGITCQCAVEEVLWATQGSLWPVCCGRAKLGYSGITLEEVLWATQGSLWPVCCGRGTLGYSGITLASVL